MNHSLALRVFVFIYCIFNCPINSKQLDNAINEIVDTLRTGEKNKCEIEISTRGTCIVNNNRLKPHVILSFKKYPHQTRQTSQPSSDLTQKPELNPLQSKQNINFKQKVIDKFFHQFVQLMKQEYSHNLEPLIIENIQYVKLKHWGNANVYDLKIFGLHQLQPVETKLLSDKSIESAEWRFGVNMYATNLTAQFKVDANLNDKILIKHWQLKLLMQNCLLAAQFTLNFDKELLKVDSLHLKSFENFQLISEPLSWPFNEIVSNIVSQEKYYIRHVIELNTQKYINMTLSQHLNLRKIIDKILAQNS